VHAERVSQITGVELQAQDPAALAARWSDLLARPASPSARGTYEIRLDQGSLRFVPEQKGQPSGITAIELAVADRPRLLEAARRRNLETADDEVRICGTWFRFTPA
jgi:hypothetical protein